MRAPGAEPRRSSGVMGCGAPRHRRHCRVRSFPLAARDEVGRFLRAWGGIAGVQSSLAVLLEQGHRRVACRSNESPHCSPPRPPNDSGSRTKAASLPVRTPTWLSWIFPDRLRSSPEHLLQRHRLSPYVGSEFRGALDSHHAARRNDFFGRRRHRENDGRTGAANRTQMKTA